MEQLYKRDSRPDADKSGPVEDRSPKDAGNPNEPTKKNLSKENDTVAPHQKIIGDDVLRASGKKTNTVTSKGVVSINPTSQQQGWGKDRTELEFEIIDKPNLFLRNGQNNVDTGFPILDLEAGQGLFIAAGAGYTTDMLVEEARKVVTSIRSRFGVVETDENGDEILEQLTVKTRSRNDDGTVKLDAKGRVIEGANFVQRPKLAFVPAFVVKAVVKDDEIGDDRKASSDGVLIVRHT